MNYFSATIKSLDTPICPFFYPHWKNLLFSVFWYHFMIEAARQGELSEM